MVSVGKGEDSPTEKNKKKCSFENLLSTLQNQLTKFLLHYFINKLQTEAYNACRLMDCDSTRFQHRDSANGLIWKLLLCLSGRSFQCPLERNSVTLYTVMIWFRDQSISMVLLSDNNDHDKTMVVPYTAYVLNYIKEHFADNVRTIEIWTDGPSS